VAYPARFGVVRLALAVTASAALYSGCGGSDATAPPTQRVPTSIQAVSQQNQSATVGSDVADRPSVVVRDQNNDPVSGVTVTFAVGQGTGSITGATQTTNASGVATVESWTLGTAVGTNTLTATATGLSTSVTFTATAVPGPAYAIEVNAAEDQTGTVGTPVSQLPSAIVVDERGNPVSGVSVTFAVATGGGSVTGVNQTTGADGIATVGSWTLGTAAGLNTLQATSDGLAGSPLTFEATGLAAAAAKLSIATGNNQEAAVGTAVAVPPSVLVTDAHDNPVGGVSVTFAVASGGGSITGATQTTTASGTAAVGSWTLGTAPGPNTLTATATGLSGSPRTFTATAETGAAVSIAVHAGNSQTATVGTPVSVRPSVKVVDGFGNPVEGVQVTFAVTAGGGSITGAVKTTNSSGIAAVGSWTLGTTAGGNLLSATAPGLAGSPVQFAATGEAGPAATVAVHGGNNQTASAGATLPVDPSVKVTDAHGNPVDDVAVTFAVSSGGGSITGANRTTNDAGIAVVGSWTLGVFAGTNTLTATVVGLPPATFTATATSSCTVTGTALGSTINSALTSSDCTLGSGEFVKFYTFTIASQRGVQIRESSNEFDTYLLLLTSDGQLVAENDDIGFPVTNSEINAILAPGTYIVAATSFASGETGAFTLSLQERAESVTGCSEMGISRNVTTAQTLAASDCPGYLDLFAVYLEAGQTVTVGMSSGAFDAYLYLADEDGFVLEENDDKPSGGPNAAITFTATEAAYYFILAASATAEVTGAYTLTVD
jgi:hypothetical protein